jgi:hypothetical protein
MWQIVSQGFESSVAAFAFAVPRVCVSLPLRVSLFPDRLLSVPHHPRPSPLITNAFDSCTLLLPPSQFLGAGFFEQSENFAIDHRNGRKEEEKEEVEE